MLKTNSRQARAALLPLGIKDRYKTELPALIALEAIGESWFSEQHVSDLLAVALVVEEIAPYGSLPSLCAEALRRQCESGISTENKTEVAMNLAECLPWLQRQPNHRVRQGLEAVSRQHLPKAA
jgi:hypothetical protein